jgi:hypothetical protein
MRLLLVMMGYSCFSLYLPACDKCALEINYLIEQVEFFMANEPDHKYKSFYEGELAGLKISSHIYESNHRLINNEFSHNH